MDKNRLMELLEKVKTGIMPVEEAIFSLRSLPYEDLGFAMIDNHRSIRQGYPEVIFCQGKTIPQIKSIAERLRVNHGSILATRASVEVYEALKDVCDDVEYNEAARVVVIGKPDYPKSEGSILIITAGTSDIPVAEEAALIAESTGNVVEKLFDVGVSGVHRLFMNVDKILKANIIIVVAGMDGALPSIIGGLVDKPVIAVPTSIGYGASFGGVAALLTMLNSCAPGVVVVNIDNGFGAGLFASMLNRRR